jgi:hypothetical protein
MDSNRVRLALVRETSLGVPPGSPRMRTMRITREGLKYTPKFFNSGEIRSDRMSADPSKSNEDHSGPIDLELRYPTDNTDLSEIIQSAMMNLWGNTPQRDNDGTAASALTSITVTTNVVACVSGSAYAVGHLVRHSGFALAANNGSFRVTAGGTTTYTCSAGGFATEATPPAAARSKVVGFQGVAGDITATATGLGATTLNFTTLGLSVGQWIKIGGTATAFRFATAANNDWIRITGISATALTCDNLPTGWTTDAGATKTINVYFGDLIRNGVTPVSVAIERGFLDQPVPTYIYQKGFSVDKLNLSLASDAGITGSADLIGMSGAQGTVANGTSYDAATTAPVLTSNASVGRIAEAGVGISSPNWVKSMAFTMMNNVRAPSAVGNVGAVSLGFGEIAITGTLETYFGSNAYLQKLLAGTVSSLSVRAAANSQALVITFPRVTFTDGSPNAGGKNQDVTLPLAFQTSIDTVTNSEIDFQRFEYFE